MLKNLLFVILTSFLLTGCGFEIVDTGHRGVETKFGKITSDSLPEGLYFYNPFTTDITELDVRTMKHEDRTTAYSSDAQLVDIVSTINFNLKPDVVHITLEKVGKDWADKLILQVLHGTVKEVVGKYKAVDLIANREKSTKEIESLLKERLLVKHIELTSFDMNNLDFDDAFENAVKNKVIAVEKAKEMKNVTVSVREKARQDVIREEAEAEKLVIGAKASATAKMLEANAEAKANNVVSRSLTPSLIEYEKIKTWNGTLPSVLTGSGSGTLISIPANSSE